ncbi:MAG TPA: SDR family NAD(P)-dependent oxidoreductase, partial [Ktedonobacterales bacterium]|nr:SDR family NAD(P)-dependent oxidoreductase [Ktedonobacterales bacterium]
MAALEGRVALVTGAASGIGLGIAQALAAEGARVTLADLDAERGQAEASKLAGARFVSADLTQSDGCRRLVEDTIATSGRLDILVNNAGVQHVAPITEFPEAKWRQLIELMLTAPFLLTQAALPGMYERR